MKTYPEVAIGDVTANIGRGRQRTRGREGKCLFEEVGVSARVPFLVKVIHESLIEAEQAGPVIDEWHGRNVVRDNIVGDRRVVDHDRIDVVVCGVGGIVHGISDVRDAACC